MPLSRPLLFPREQTRLSCAIKCSQGRKEQGVDVRANAVHTSRPSLLALPEDGVAVEVARSLNFFTAYCTVVNQELCIEGHFCCVVVFVLDCKAPARVECANVQIQLEEATVKLKKQFGGIVLGLISLAYRGPETRALGLMGSVRCLFERPTTRTGNAACGSPLTGL
ncbi:hypothetical protein B0H14DRAFT_2940760 [Mycena olivaceomarginata]|nr:hypothetical protein B0H14DRAFT_2940760 [Mycena olivaceomarginata]